MSLPDLSDVFGSADEEKTRGRPKRRSEETTVVSFNVPQSIAEVGHEKTRQNRGVLTRYLTACYALFIELPISDILGAVSAFEEKRGATIETLTAESLHYAGTRTPAGAQRTTRLRLTRRKFDVRAGGGLPDGPQADETQSPAPAEAGPSKAVA